MLARTEATLVVQSSKLGSNDKSDGEHSRFRGRCPLTSALSTPVFLDNVHTRGLVFIVSVGVSDHKQPSFSRSRHFAG